MEPFDSPLTDLLLQSGNAVALQFDAGARLQRVGNAKALQSWLPPDAALPEPGAPMAQVLNALFEDARAAQLLQAFAPPEAQAGPGLLEFTAVPGRPLRLAPPRWFDVRRTTLPGATGPQSVLLVTDRTPLHALAHEASEARDARELALCVLRTEAPVLRQLLQNAASAVGFIRATLRKPSRTQEALREKLRQLHSEATTIATAARDLPLAHVATPAQALVDALDQLLAMEMATGDDLLPLARRIDALSAAISAASALDEQRAVAAPASRGAGAPRVPKQVAPVWHEGCEQRVGELLQRIGEECGVLARLRMKGTALVPAAYQRHVDAMLEPLIDNALRHGIEPPEARVAADKLAAGTLTISFRDRGPAGLEITVHDDGRGFDIGRIRDAAIACGLTTDEAAAALEARELVGLIFRPGFSTQSLPGATGGGRSMALLRESLQRRGGNVSVATKPQRYTQFTLRMPNASVARRAPPRTSTP